MKTPHKEPIAVRERQPHASTVTSIGTQGWAFGHQKADSISLARRMNGYFNIRVFNVDLFHSSRT